MLFRSDFKDYDAAELAAIFVKIVQRNDFKLSEDASLTAIESILSSKFAPALRRRWNGGLPEGLFRRARDALAKRLNVLGMEINYHNRKKLNYKIEKMYGANYWKDLDKMLAYIDVLSIHCPYTPETFQIGRAHV